MSTRTPDSWPPLVNAETGHYLADGNPLRLRAYFNAETVRRLRAGETVTTTYGPAKLATAD